MQILANVKKDSIMIRWAPSKYSLWKDCNKTGYTLERITMFRNNKKLINPESKILTNRAKPLPKQWWEKEIQDSTKSDYDHLCIAAQALFGEDFNPELESSSQNSMIRLIEKSQSQESRFLFALLAADQSLRLSKAMGLYFCDKTAKKEEMYLYKIYPTEINYMIDTSYIYTGLMDYTDLPKPLGLKINSRGNKIMISWNQYLLSSIYTCYFIEKSDNGENFNALNKAALVVSTNEKGDMQKYMMYSDSLEHYNKDYYYRIYAKNAFGEKSPYSETIKTKAIVDFKPMFTKIDTELKDDNTVNITWDVDSSSLQYIKEFRITRSFKAKTEKYTDISGSIDKSIRSFRDSLPMSSNYYKIKIISKYDQEKTSVPLFVQTLDTIAPAPPTIKSIIADSTGIVNIKWEANKESDLLGYRIFRSNFLCDEFSQISKQYTADTSFRDSINLNNLTSKIYYKLAAIDYRYNQSDLSKEFMLIKPDTISPNSPVIKAYEIKSNSVLLSWTPSYSEDKEWEYILRTDTKTNKTDSLLKSPAQDSLRFFEDKTIKAGHKYLYQILARDYSGNFSAKDKYIELECPDDGIGSNITAFNARANKEESCVDLSWNSKQEIKAVKIYKSDKQGNLRFYKYLKAVKNYKDKDVYIGLSNTYRIQLEYTDGSFSKFSDKINIGF
ncbi:MAG: hypothetical protein N4A49_05910 [Marinifilaceae bacterium]|nr:hypothetical protein [Marinifilaceae bacterium]